MSTNKWHYDIVRGFNEDYFSGLITSNLLNSREIHIEEAKGKRGTIEPLSEEFFYVAKKDKTKYLIPSKFVEKKMLPLKIEDSMKVSFRSKGYRYPTKIKPMTIRAEKKMEFEDMVNSFLDSEHSNKKDDWYWRLICLVSYIDRINVRVATPPSFGKDSKMRALGALVGNVGVISNATRAKMEYLLFNDVILLNEVSHIGSGKRSGIEQFLLTVGDYSNKYTKSSRSTKGSQENYDISDLSMVIAYNTLDNYEDESKYFDFMWDNTGAINDRFLPLKFDGVLKEEFEQPHNISEAVKENKSYFLDMIRTVLYFKRNRTQKKFRYKLPPQVDNLGSRWKRAMKTLMYYLSLCCSTQQEFTERATYLYEKHLDYMRMLGKDVDGMVSEEDIEDKEVDDTETKIKEYVVEKDKGDGVNVDDIIGDLGVEEKDIQTLLTQGVVFQNKPGKVKLL